MFSILFLMSLLNVKRIDKAAVCVSVSLPWKGHNILVLMILKMYVYGEHFLGISILICDNQTGLNTSAR